MALRWRFDPSAFDTDTHVDSSPLLCAAKHEAEDDDTYIDDRLHYHLSVVAKAIVPDVDEETNGRWHWVGGNLFLRGSLEAAP